MRKCIIPIAALMVTAAHGLSIQFMNVIPETCGNGNGRVDAMVTGGVWPYSYLWSNGGTTESITGVSSGTYTLTVTDNVGTVVSDDVFVPNLPNLPWADGGSYAIPDGLGGETWRLRWAMQRHDRFSVGDLGWQPALQRELECGERDHWSLHDARGDGGVRGLLPGR